MSDNLSVVIDSTKEEVRPSLEEEAKKYDSPAPADPERPQWLPEKFKSAEDLAKAYSELERKLSSKAPESPVDGNDQEKATEVATEEEAADEAPEGLDEDVKNEAEKAVEKAGLDFDELSTKYWEKGELDESDYKKLEKAGIPKALVDQFINGQEALLNTARQSVFSEVGGEEAYFSMTEWAGENYTKSEIEAFNKAVNSGDMQMTMMAVKGLQARYKAEVGFEPSRQVTGANTKATASVYRSLAEMQKDMSDPRYQTDPAFRKDVEQKLARSDLF